MAVETALLLPLLFIIAAGMIDLTLLLRDHVAATSLARAGARVASAEPRFGTVGGHSGGLSFAQDAADAMARSATTLPRDAIDFIWVYRATAAGTPESGNFDSCPASSCVVYRWVDGSGGSPGRFTYQSGTWSPSSINACLGDADAQSVGVYVQATHPWVVGLVFGGTSTKVRAYSVMKFEPLYPTHTIPNVVPGCKP